jgi:hypothetical protein
LTYTATRRAVQQTSEPPQAAASSRPAKGPLGILRSYLFWTYERGSFHYDVMVTVILLFLFIAPHFIDFHDRPLPEVPARSNEFLLRESGQFGTIQRFVFSVRAEDLHNAHSEADIRAQIANRVANFAPDAQIDTINPVKDPRGQIVRYDATVLRGHPNGQE